MTINSATMHLNPLFHRLPFDLRNPILYVGSYVFIFLTIPAFSQPILGLYMMFLGSALHIRAFFKDLKSQTQLLSYEKLHPSDQDTYKEYAKRFGKFVADHQRIIDAVHKLNEVFAEIFALYFLEATSILCSQAYLATLVGRIGPVTWNHSC